MWIGDFRKAVVVIHHTAYFRIAIIQPDCHSNCNVNATSARQPTRVSQRKKKACADSSTYDIKYREFRRTQTERSTLESLSRYYTPNADQFAQCISHLFYPLRLPYTSSWKSESWESERWWWTDSASYLTKCVDRINLAIQFLCEVKLCSLSEDGARTRDVSNDSCTARTRQVTSVSLNISRSPHQYHN